MEDTFTDNLIHKYMFVTKRAANIVHDGLETLGLYRGQPVMLNLLWDKDGLSGRELSELMEVQPATVTKMVRRLKASGFVTTKQDSRDSRVSRVYLTDQGRAVKSEVVEVYKGIQDTVFKGFSQEEIQVFQTLLDQIGDNVRTMSERGMASHE